MANQVFGRVIAVSETKTVASTDANKQPLQKREIFIDCTRHDQYTGERSGFENKMVLEFSGKNLEKCNVVLSQAQKDDIVAISFDLQGVPIKDLATGKTRYLTFIRCYDIKTIRKAGQEYFSGHQPHGQAAAPQPAQQQAVVTQTAQSPFPPQGHDAPGSDKDLPF